VKQHVQARAETLDEMHSLAAQAEVSGRLRIYHHPEGFMHWCTQCGACLESKSKSGIFRRIDRHMADGCKRRTA
jgi:hypothetical protein